MLTFSNVFRMLTFFRREIDAMDKWEGAELNKAKEILAFELNKSCSW